MPARAPRASPRARRRSIAPPADVTLAQSSYDRASTLAATQAGSQARLDEATDALRVAQRTYDQARLSYQEAVAGFTAEEVRMAEAKVVQADAAVQTLQSLVDQTAVAAPEATRSTKSTSSRVRS